MQSLIAQSNIFWILYVFYLTSKENELKLPLQLIFFPNSYDLKTQLKNLDFFKI